MTQHRAGDASIVINGEKKTLRLTLGALAALEEGLGQGDFSTLQRRLETPRIADLLMILQALLQGGGFQTTLDALKASDVDLAGAARAIAEAFRSLSSPSPPSSSSSSSLSPAFGGEGRVRGRRHGGAVEGWKTDKKGDPA